ncbi:MAG: LysR family transcriptional regulator [Gammaproteobacteria bacterium]|nr:MAG: LysR family transcriptional regulator [Gammaproteobacteria bacterium]
MNNIHTVPSILEIRHLRTLRAIEETGSLAAAAQMISLTQSALSHQLKQLETHYEVPLFQRNTRPMTLTETGRRLLNLANDILPRIDEAESILTGPVSHAKRFLVAIECHSCFDWLLPALNHVRKHWPELDVDAQMVFDALPLLKKHDIDVVITSDPIDSKDIIFIELFQYEAQLLLSPQHRLSNKKIIQPKDIANETLITYPVDPERLDIYRHFLQPAGLPMAKRRTSELTDMIVQHVDSCRGIAVLPDWVLQNHALAKNLVTRSLGKHGVHRTVFAAVRNIDAENIELKNFIDFTPSVIRNLKK